MKLSGWKDIAEVIGISAIVASLVSAGVQLKQEQMIALAEVYATSESSAAGSNDRADLSRCHAVCGHSKWRTYHPRHVPRSGDMVA